MVTRPAGALLAVDVGNTNTVLGLYEDGQLLRHWRLTTRRDETADEIGRASCRERVSLTV